MVKAIEVTKRYTHKEVKKLSELFLYLNDIDGLMDEYKYGVSAKGLWKLLEPLTRTGNPQPFREWRESVSNISRLKEKEDFIQTETITKVKTTTFAWRGKSQQAKKGRWGDRGFVPVKEIDYILTLRAGEYCATLTKGDAGDLYRRFIFDIKDEFIRLVFRWGKSIDTRIEFTNSISKLDFVQALKKKQQGELYAKFTNKVYQELQDVELTAEDYKKKHGISKREIAKHYFNKDGLLNLEKVESKLATIIDYAKPNNEKKLENTFDKFFDSLEE